MRIDRWKVRQLMKRQGIGTFTELADRIDVSKQAISRWFAGHSFSSGNLAALCRELDCSPNEVLTMDSDPNQTAPEVEERAKAGLQPMTA